MLIVDRYGNQREYDGEVVPDGYGIKVPMTFMDSMQRAVARSAKRPLHDGRGNRAGHRPGFVYGDGNNDAKAQAFADANRDAEEAWKRPAGGYPPEGAKAGDLCTYNGAPGHLRERDGGLVCVPDEQHDAARFDDRE